MPPPWSSYWTKNEGRWRQRESQLRSFLLSLTKGKMMKSFVCVHLTQVLASKREREREQTECDEFSPMMIDGHSYSSFSSFFVLRLSFVLLAFSFFSSSSQSRKVSLSICQYVKDRFSSPTFFLSLPLPLPSFLSFSLSSPLPSISTFIWQRIQRNLTIEKYLRFVCISRFFPLVCQLSTSVAKIDDISPLFCTNINTGDSQDITQSRTIYHSLCREICFIFFVISFHFFNR